jgi:hypothetical protein
MGSKPGRTLINWEKDNKLSFLKALAGNIRVKEGVRNPEALWNRVAELCFSKSIEILGFSTTLEKIVEHVKQRYGTELTSHKLAQRADKFERYEEVNEKGKKLARTWTTKKNPRTPITAVEKAAEQGISLSTLYSRANRNLVSGTVRVGNSWVFFPETAL